MLEYEDVESVFRASFQSPNCPDANLEPSNIVDGLFAIAHAITKLSRTIEAVSANKIQE